MRNTKATEAIRMALIAAATTGSMAAAAPAFASDAAPAGQTRQAVSNALDARQQAIVPISAFAAAGDMAGLNKALEQGLAAGLSVNEAKEILCSSTPTRVSRAA